MNTNNRLVMLLVLLMLFVCLLFVAVFLDNRKSEKPENQSEMDEIVSIDTSGNEDIVDDTDNTAVISESSVTENSTVSSASNETITPETTVSVVIGEDDSIVPSSITTMDRVIVDPGSFELPRDK